MKTYIGCWEKELTKDFLHPANIAAKHHIACSGWISFMSLLWHTAQVNISNLPFLLFDNLQ
jgi:hypothetical protein